MKQDVGLLVGFLTLVLVTDVSAETPPRIDSKPTPSSEAVGRAAHALPEKSLSRGTLGIRTEGLAPKSAPGSVQPLVGRPSHLKSDRRQPLRPTLSWGRSTFRRPGTTESLSRPLAPGYRPSPRGLPSFSRSTPQPRTYRSHRASPPSHGKTRSPLHRWWMTGRSIRRTDTPSSRSTYQPPAYRSYRTYTPSFRSTNRPPAYRSYRTYTPPRFSSPSYRSPYRSWDDSYRRRQELQRSFHQRLNDRQRQSYYDRQRWDQNRREIYRRSYTPSYRSYTPSYRSYTPSYRSYTPSYRSSSPSYSYGRR
jgi:hypothetical protein